MPISFPRIIAEMRMTTKEGKERKKERKKEIPSQR